MSNQPNFLVIMTDQHCYDQLACHGNSLLKTPNLDRLFARGTSINGMHTVTPICMPNRQAFLTMRMNSVNGGHSNGVGLSLDSNTFAELLRASGYKTALIGKSHLQNITEFEPFLQADPAPDDQVAPPAELAHAYKSAPSYFGQAYMQERPIMWADADFEPKTPYYGFDEVIFASHHNEVAGYHHKRKLDAIDPAIVQKKGRQHALKASSHNPITYATAITEEEYSTRFVGDESIAWLERHADTLRHLGRLGAPHAQEPGGNSPFFLWCSIPDPHVPWTPPEKYYDMYDPADIVLPDSFYDSSRTHTAGLRWAYNNELNNNRQPRMPFMTEEEEAKRIIATTYGMITFLDEVVGELLATLEETGMADNTVILFTSDHGDYMGHHGLFLKGPLHYQALVKVPFIWCDPCENYNRGPINALASYVDIGRTILDRAGLWPYHGTQGRSLLPLLAGEANRHRTRVLVESVSFSPQFGFPLWSKVRTLVTERYRITVYTHSDEGELYDLQNDPLELVNLWNSSAHAAPKSDMLFQLVQEMADLTDTSRLPMRLA